MPTSIPHSQPTKFVNPDGRPTADYLSAYLEPLPLFNVQWDQLDLETTFRLIDCPSVPATTMDSPSNPDAHASAMDIDACGSSEGGVDLATVLGLRDADLEKALEIWDTLKNHPLGDEMLATVLERAWAQHLAAMEKKPAASAIDFFPPIKVISGDAEEQVPVEEPAVEQVPPTPLSEPNERGPGPSLSRKTTQPVANIVAIHQIPDGP